MTCSECKRELTKEDIYQEDIGIGPYEFWGSKGIDIQIVWSSKCCDAAVEFTKEEENEYFD